VNSLLSRQATHVRVREALVSASSPYQGKKLGEIGLPKGIIVVCIVRDGEATIPDGETYLMTDDNVVILGGDSELACVLAKIRGESL